MYPGGATGCKELSLSSFELEKQLKHKKRLSLDVTSTGMPSLPNVHLVRFY